MGLKHFVISSIKKRYLVVLYPPILTLFWNMTMDLNIPFYYYILVTGNTLYVSVIGNLENIDAADDINLEEDYKWSPEDTKKLRRVLQAISLSTLALAIMGGWKFLIFGFLINTLGFVYAKEIKIKGQVYRIKNITWVKNLYTAMLGAPGFILAPYLYVGAPIDVFSIGPMVIGFFMVFFVEMFWDVRDVKGDTLSGVKTVPVVYGLRFTRWFLHGLNLLVFTLTLLSYWFGGIAVATLSLLLYVVVTGIVIEWSFKLESKHFAAQIHVLAILIILSLGVAIDWIIA